jgi:hypothetical protein
MKEKELKREDLDAYLLKYYFKLLLTPGFYEVSGEKNGRKLRKDINFSFANAPNRNPKIISEGVWKSMVYYHLRRYIYN